MGGGGGGRVGGRHSPGTYQDIPLGVPDLSVLTIYEACSSLIFMFTDMFTTIFRFELNSFGMQGVLGAGVGSANPVTTDPRLTQPEFF